MREKRNKIIGVCISSTLIIVVISIAIFLAIKYQVEGEKNMPYNLGKIIVISSAVTNEYKEENDNSIQKTEENNNQEQQNQSEENNQQENPTQESVNYVWDENVVQTNDVYIYISKNENYKEDESIKSVRIENIKILKKVNIGKIQVYMPNSLDGELYKYINDFIVSNSLTYTGGQIDNKKTLEVCSKGGTVCISFANIGLGRYQSNEDEQIEQGASILKKMNLNEEDLKFKVSFDVVIDIGKKAYKGNVVLDLPIDGLVGNKESHTEITDFSNVVFKRCGN